MTSDLVGPEKRQIAIGRTLMGSMTGNLLGASVSGLIGDFLGWRGVLAVLGYSIVGAAGAITTFLVAFFMRRLAPRPSCVRGKAVNSNCMVRLPMSAAFRVSPRKAG